MFYFAIIVLLANGKRYLDGPWSYVWREDQNLERDTHFTHHTGMASSLLPWTIFNVIFTCKSCVLSFKFEPVSSGGLKGLDTVFRRPYRCFSIAFEVILFLSNRYKLFTNDWQWIEVCQNAVFRKIDFTMTTMSKKLWHQ